MMRAAPPCLTACALLLGCSSKIVPPEGSGGSGATTGTDTGSVTSATGTGGSTAAPLSLAKVDVVFAVDNSGGSPYFTDLTIDAANVLLARLVNPECVDGAGNVQVVADPTTPCPSGFRRAFRPVDDMHVGVISSSLGALGSGFCETDGFTETDNPTNDDRGHLIWRTNPSPAATANSPGVTYEDRGFFVWDPGATQSPPGTADLSDLQGRLGDVLRGAGNVGCGFEMPLESAYRFLADPAPYDRLIEVSGGSIPEKAPSGVDSVLLAQRAAFLRDDSVVIVVMLGNENDCSIVAEGQSWALLRNEPWFRGAAICATDPADACCYSCGVAPPPGCAADPTCATSPKWAPDEDSVNLRCNMQKERYGASLLYPIQRYVNAFTSEVIAPGAPDLAPGAGPEMQNPLLAGRSAADVFLITLAGVPWQATVEDPRASVPRLHDAPGLAAVGFWDRFVGAPDRGVAPLEPIMRESIDPRDGVPPGNPYNGNDYPVLDRNDMQLACIFPLAAPVPYASMCASEENQMKPICDGTTQTHGAVYPGARQLHLANGLGAQSVVASACPPEAVDTTSPAYGYRLAVDALARRLHGR